MAERFVYSVGTISVANGATSVTGIGTTWGNRDRAGSFIYVMPAAAAPIFIGVVAETDPRNDYANTTLPLVTAYNGTSQVSQPYVLVDGLAIANSATLAANLARFNAFLEENAGLVISENDDYDEDLLPNNTLVIDELTGEVKFWRNGVLQTLFAVVTGTAAFSAHKNGTNQTTIADNTYTQVTFGTEIFDTGGLFASSAWTPPAGKVILNAAAVFSGSLDATALQQIAIYKNGSLLEQSGVIGTTATAAPAITVIDDANGTDVYTVYAKINVTASTGTVSGTATETYFNGSMLPQQGAAGAAGAAGGDGGFRFLFNSATSGDPASGKFLFDNGTFGSATAFHVSETSEPGGDVAALLSAIDDSTSANKCLVLAFKEGTGGEYRSFFITATGVDPGAYRTFTITPISSFGTISNDDACRLFFGIIGNKGDTGATGISGVDGTSLLSRVRVVITDPVDLAGGGLANGTTHDGIVVATGNAALVVGQAYGEENGVYTVPASGAASRLAAFNTYSVFPGSYFSVMEGNDYEDTLWRCTSDIGGTINVDDLVIEEAAFGGGGLTFAATAPVSPSPGEFWMDSNTGILYIYVDDGSSQQWVGININQLTGAVSYTQTQTLTSAEQAQARVNIDAAPASVRTVENSAINGNVDVSQELLTAGATLTNNTNKYTADCWEAMYNHGAATAVVTSGQVAASSFVAALPGYNFGHRIKATTAITSIANGDFARHRQQIEGYRVARYAWGTSGACAAVVLARWYSTGAGVGFIRVTNAAGNRAYHREVTLAAGWNAIREVIPGDTSGTWEKGSSAGMIVDFFAAGKAASPATPNAWGATPATQTTNSVNLLDTNNDESVVTGFNVLPVFSTLEIPTVEQMMLFSKPFDEELILSMRYYEKTYRYGDAIGATNAQGAAVKFALSTSVLWSESSYRVEKRADPTIIAYGTSTGTINKARQTVSNTEVTVTGPVHVSTRGFQDINSSALFAITVVNNCYDFHWTAGCRL